MSDSGEMTEITRHNECVCTLQQLIELLVGRATSGSDGFLSGNFIRSSSTNVLLYIPHDFVGTPPVEYGTYVY